MFGREKRQEERIETLERRVFLLESQIDQLRAEKAATTKPRKTAASK